ncbi:MAG TPA: ATP-binding protein [Gemmatimonadales bacterium]|nr:ATP-binding protein [Gemmatimonadales bacterium]
MAHELEIGRYAMTDERRSWAGIDWARLGANVSGPLLTMATAIILDLLTRHGILIPSPFPLLLLTLVLATLWGGLRPGLISALLVVLYALHFLSESGHILRYTPEDRRSLVLVALIAPTIVLLLSSRRTLARGAAAPTLVAPGADRTVGVVAEMSQLLASSLEYETTLQTVCKLAVPALADWCLVHVIGPGRTVSYVASSHRELAREVVLHGLRRYVPRELSATLRGDPAVPEPVLVEEVRPEDLQELAQDEEHLRRLQALAPGSYMVVPLVARGQVLGALTLAMAESGRRYAEADLVVAGQLAATAALSVDAARLEHDADAAEQRYRLLFENNPQPMWVFDVETLQFLAVNDAAVRHYGYARDEFLSLSVMDLRPPDDVAARLHPPERPVSGREQVAVTQHQKKDGGIVDVEIASHELPLGTGRARLVQVTDITERTRTKAALHQSEEQLRQVQKLDAVGRLATGIAHDFNNVLTAIHGYSELLLRDLPRGDAHAQDVEKIRRAAERGALLTRQLLAFGRRPRAVPQPVEVNEVVRGMEHLVQRLLGADIQLATVLAPEVGRVRADPSQVEQVIMNLVLNARDAMPHGGTLTIETAERVVGAASRGRQLKPGRYLTLAVSDTGHGMDGETQARLFQPFFTTKDPASGAGLGLSIVYGIVRQAGGVVRVSSEPGQGTVVKVYWPLLEAPAAEAAAPESADADALRGLETILLVEDEEGVRELLRKMLVRQGYAVIEARHGRDALLALERHRGPLHLVITDVVMPEMGGRELADRLLALRPGLRVLFISGYTNDEIVRRGISESDLDFIQKPFGSDDFLRKVRELLDATAAGAGTRDGRGAANGNGNESGAGAPAAPTGEVGEEAAGPGG